MIESPTEYKSRSHPYFILHLHLETVFRQPTNILIDFHLFLFVVIRKEIEFHQFNPQRPAPAADH